MPPVRKLLLTFEAQDSVIPPQALGAMWRSVFGAALRKRDRDLYEQCFNPPPPASGRMAEQPPPFAIDAPAPAETVVGPGEHLAVGLSLFGDIPADPLINAFASAAAEGLGKGRGEAQLVEVMSLWREDGDESPNAPPELPTPPPCPAAVRVALNSPVRIRESGAFVDETRFAPKFWINALLRRISMLEALYGDPGPTPPYVDKVPMHDAQIWLRTQHRWSAAQRRQIDLSGVMGSFVLPLDGLEEHWPLLWLGQWTQVGSATVQGLGAYRLRLT